MSAHRLRMDNHDDCVKAPKTRVWWLLFRTDECELGGGLGVSAEIMAAGMECWKTVDFICCDPESHRGGLATGNKHSLLLSFEREQGFLTGGKVQ